MKGVNKELPGPLYIVLIDPIVQWLRFSFIILQAKVKEDFDRERFSYKMSYDVSRLITLNM